MKAAFIKFSELGNRLDASFHLLRSEHKEAAEKLSSKFSFEEAKVEAVRILKNLPTELRREIDPLVRTGGRRLPDIHDQTRAVEEYPYLALAVFAVSADKAIAHYQGEAANAASSITMFEEFKGSFS